MVIISQLIHDIVGDIGRLFMLLFILATALIFPVAIVWGVIDLIIGGW